MVRDVSMMALGGNPALVIIDVQQGLDDPSYGRRNNPDAETNIARLLRVWRENEFPVIFIQHLSQNPESPLAPGTPGSPIKEIVAPQGNEPVIQKRVNSAFIGTDLEERLRTAGIKALVMTGLTTNHCVDTTTRMAANLGFNTYLVSDATATFDRTGADGKVYAAEEIQAITLANLHQEFATIITTDELVRGALEVD